MTPLPLYPRLLMALVLLVALLSMACGPGGYCLTDAGIVLMTPGTPGVCQNLQAAEDRAVKGLGAVPGWTPGYVQSRLEGVELYFVPADELGEWTDDRKGRVRGLTECTQVSLGQSVIREDVRVYLGSDDFLDIPFPHEMAHVVEPCLKNGHEDWKERGIEAAIERAAVLP